MRCSIWYHLYNFKNVKNTHGGVLLLVKLQAHPATLPKVTLLHGYFLRFLNCTTGTKSRDASHMNSRLSLPTLELRLRINRLTWYGHV